MGAAKKPRRKVRILVADDAGVFRLGLKRLFGVEDDLRVVAEADQATQVLELAKKFKPDLLYLQAEMLGPDPADFMTKLHHEWPAGRAIVITSGAARDGSELYVQAGARGVILKSVEPEVFIATARKVMDNEICVPKSSAAEAAPAPADPERRPADTLTRREKSVISCLVQGWHNREIATHLKISEQTVKNHLRTIYDKVGVSDRLELALYAIHKRMDLPPVAATTAEATP